MTKLKIFIVTQVILGNLLWFIAVQCLLRIVKLHPLSASPLPPSFINLYFGLEYFYFGMVVSQISLLGFWAGMGLTVWWKRLLGFLAGVSGLWFVGALVAMDYGIFESLYFTSVDLFYLFGIGGVIAITSFLLHRFGVQLQRISEEEKNKPTPKMQFSLRSLFVVTFCAALLSLLAGLNRDGILTLGGVVVVYNSLVFVLVISITTLLCLWAALRLHSPVMPAVIAVVVVLLMYLVLIWSIEPEYSMRNLIWIGIAFLSHFIWTFATLLVLRSYGYRLTSR